MPYASYERHKDKVNEAAAENYRSTRDCFVYAQKREWTWEPKDPKRRESCRLDLERFLLTYDPTPFDLAFSSSHKRLISNIQKTILESGSEITAMPRGSGKTTIKMRSLLWAALFGHRRFPVLGTADDDQFRWLMQSIKMILETNELLREDFPEVVIPIRHLERVATKCVYQLYRNEPTYMRWGDNFILFPTTTLTLERGNAGVVISGSGLTGALRGMVYALPNGDQIRPDAVLLDDIQTRKSAKSPSMCDERLSIVKSDIGRMRGVRPLALMVTCTPIYVDDVAERLLCPKTSPNFKSFRIPTFLSMPTNMDKWEEYDVIRRQELLGEIDEGAVNEFYEQNREELDEGAEHYWPEKCDEGKVSAIQCAMERYLDDPDGFATEEQCQPQALEKSDIVELVASDLIKRVTAYPQGVVQPDHTVLTAHIDVQAKVLYYAVCSWSAKFGGSVIEYNTWPRRQAGRHFTLRSLRKGLAQAYPRLDEGGQLRAGIRDCIQYLSQKRFPRADSGDLGINRILVDGRWKVDDVESGVIESGSPIAQIGFGTGIGAVHAPMAKWPKQPGRLFGDHWIEDKPSRRQRRAVHIDVNHWKGELHAALSVPDVHHEALRFYKAAASYHQLIADHCCSETAHRVESRDRIVDEWHLKFSTLDNHYWDNLVGCMVGASREGIRKQHANNVVKAKKRPAKKDRIRSLSI